MKSSSGAKVSILGGFQPSAYYFVRILRFPRDGSMEQSSISYWERGLKQPELTIPQVKALCKALNVSLDELPDYFG